MADRLGGAVSYRTLSTVDLEGEPASIDAVHALWAEEGFELSSPSQIKRLVEGVSSWVHVGAASVLGGNELVAACAVVTYRDSGLDLVGIVERIVVAGAWRRAGVGSGLLRYCESRARAQGLDLLIASSRRPASIAMFSTVGWAADTVTNLFLPLGPQRLDRRAPPLVGPAP